MVIEKIKFIVLFLYLFTINSYSNSLQYLNRTLENQTPFDTVSKKWRRVSDDDTKKLDLGFDFPFNGTSYSSIRISSNGALTFGSDGDFPYENEDMPYRDISVFPYWDDLNPSKGGKIKYGQLDKNKESERFVVSWEDVPHYNDSGSYTFQVVLYKNGNIRFRYDENSDADGTLCGDGCQDYGNNGATIGLQEDSSHYDRYSYDSAIDKTKDVLYYPPFELQMNKSSCVIDDPVNGTTNPKRIPNATIRYAIEVQNSGSADVNNVIVTDKLNSEFDLNSISNLQIKNEACDCLGISSASSNGTNGSANGENPVKLDFGIISNGTNSSPTIECGYFEVKIK